jgi:hypothetical protein
MCLLMALPAARCVPADEKQSADDLLVIGQVTGSTATLTYDRAKLLSGLSGVFAELNGSRCTLTTVTLVSTGKPDSPWALAGMGTYPEDLGAYVQVSLTLLANGNLGIGARFAGNTCAGNGCKLCKFNETTGCECTNYVPGKQGYCDHTVSDGMDRTRFFR